MRRLIFAISMLTRIPMPFLNDLEPKEIGQSSMLFPIVGAIVGAWLVGVNFLAHQLWDKPLLASICTLIAWIAITGGFHLDGLMDTCDGLFSGRPRAEMLRIMKDSHVGAFGVIGLVCVLLLKIGGLQALADRVVWRELLMVPIFGRWGMTYATVVFRYAREEKGLGSAFAEFSDWKCLFFASIFTLGVAGVVFRQDAIILILPLVALVGWIGWWLAKQLGGLTGDTYGAVCELTEMFCLMVLSTKFILG